MAAPTGPVDPLDRSRFPVDPWRLVECAYGKDDLGLTETLFSVSNGYLGLRGSAIDPNGAAIFGTPDTETSFKSDFYAALSGRFGFAAGPALLYVKGGPRCSGQRRRPSIPALRRR